MTQGGLPDTGNIFDQQVAFGQKSHDRQVNGALFSFYCLGDGVTQRENLVPDRCFECFHVTGSILAQGQFADLSLSDDNVTSLFRMKIGNGLVINE